MKKIMIGVIMLHMKEKWKDRYIEQAYDKAIIGFLWNLQKWEERKLTKYDVQCTCTSMISDLSSDQCTMYMYILSAKEAKQTSRRKKSKNE